MLDQQSHYETDSTPCGAQPADLTASVRSTASGRPQFDPTQAKRFLEALGVDPAAAWFRNIRPGKAPNSQRGGRDLHGFNAAKLAADVKAGESLYLITGTAERATGVSKRTGKPTGCVQDSDVIACSALFQEWDDKPTAWQLTAWKELNLPEPTAQVFTGGTSIWNWWVFDEPLPPAQWQVLQDRLIAHCQSDSSCSNASRLARLPGGVYFDKATGKAAGQCVVVHESGKRYSAADMAAALPELPQVPTVEHSATTAATASNSTRSTASSLPPRDLEQIRLAAQHIPQRVPGASKAGGSDATGGYEPSRRALCGCSAALAEAGIADPDTAALDLLTCRWPDRATAQQVLSSSSTRDPAAFWAIAKQYGYDTRRSTRQTADEQRAEQDAAADGMPFWTDEQLAAELAKAKADREQRQGFKVLGWDADRKVVFYRHRQTSQIASVKPYGPAELLKLAPAAQWEKEHPRYGENKKTGKKEVIGVAWTAAADWLIVQANMAGVFEPERVRGRGVWLDSGNRVVWHLGDRLEVNGTITRLADHESRHHYGRLPALPINPAVEPLDDAHGRKILAVIKEMGWAGESDYLHVAGHAVTSNVGGALVKRPQLQSESPWGSGKTDNLENVLTPLQAGIGYSSAGSTEAGIRQLVGSDSLPVTVDESEQEDGKKREALLRLVRYNFDGTEQNKGTPSGQGLRFRMRSSIALAGINAPIPNPADRSRIAVVTRKPIPGNQWADVAARRAELISNEVGERLIRRTVTHLPALLANITTFGKVIAGMVTTGDSGRAGDTWGALLAGAHHLTSTAVLTEGQAAAWLQMVGWDYSHTNSDETDRAAGAEGRQCLDHLLAHEIRWRVALDPESDAPSTDAITIRELVQMVRDNARSEEGREAIKALGRKGIKVTDEGDLAVAHATPGTQAIFGTTKWGQGAHRKRLLELPGTTVTSGTVHFATDSSRRAVLVPWSALEHAADQSPAPAPAPAAAEPPAPAAEPAAPAPAPAPAAPFEWFPATEPPREWIERFAKIARRSPRPTAYEIAGELAPEGQINGMGKTVEGWLRWLDSLEDEFSDAA